MKLIWAYAPVRAAASVSISAFLLAIRRPIAAACIQLRALTCTITCARRGQPGLGLCSSRWLSPFSTRLASASLGVSYAALGEGVEGAAVVVNGDAQEVQVTTTTTLSWKGLAWVVLISLVMLTTIQVQDLKDQEGDRAAGLGRDDESRLPYAAGALLDRRLYPKDSISAEAFAEIVVSDVLATNKGGLISRGPYAAMLRRIGQWAPTWLADYLLGANQGLEELSKRK